MIAWGRRVGCRDAGHVFDRARGQVATRLLVDDSVTAQSNFLLELADNPAGLRSMEKATARDIEKAAATPLRRFSWRGFMLDEARHFFGVETVKACLDHMADNGLNVFHWHLTDDQGWRLDLPQFPELAAIGSVRPHSPPRGCDTGSDGTPYGPYAYTPSEVRNIIAYAKRRGILVVPEIELPGHTRALLAAHPEFGCEGAPRVETPWCEFGICEDVLCAGNDEAMDFLERVLDAVMELFPSTFIHIGGDECPKEHWKTCPKCQARIRDERLADENALQGWVTRRMVRHIASRGRRAVGWDEILEGGDLPRGTVVQCWRWSERAMAALEQGLDVVMSPLESTYLSIPEGLPGDRCVYRAYTVASGRILTKEKIRAFDPCAGIPEDLRAHVLGAECCAWSEVTYGESELRYKTFGRLEAFHEAMERKP